MKNKKTEPVSITFDVFLCHNSDDKVEIRGIADKLIEQGIKPWLDEREIRPGTSWQIALEEQIGNIKSAAIFIGRSGIGPWQNMEIRAYINEFVEHNYSVIPAILPTAEKTPTLPIFLKHLQIVDFRALTPDPWMQLRWGITGKRSSDDTTLDSESDDKVTLLPEKEKKGIELRLSGNLDDLSNDEKEKLLAEILENVKSFGEIKITALRQGSVRVFLELTPEQADMIYAAVKNGELSSLGITEARLYPSLIDPPDEEQRAQLLILLNRVNEYWIDGVLKQSLYHQILITLGKHAMNDAVESPWNQTIDLPTQRQQLQLSNSRIETVFDATGLLLILGEPGSGKSITLLELASLLINRAATDSKERIPVVLNLSSWKSSQTLFEWISEKLSSMYQVPSQLARDWLNKGYIIPLLDGLDEVRIENQPKCVEAINYYIDEADPPGLVVCCRLKDYLWLPERLKLNGAICIEPLNQNQIDSYFAKLGTEVESLRTAIREDIVLQELAQSPLMLNIMSMAYRSSTPESLSACNLPIEKRRTKIFDAYVEKVFLRKEIANKQPFLKENTLIWLSWLAKKLKEHSQFNFFIENMQPSWLDDWKQRFTYRGISSLALGISIFPCFVLIFFITAFTYVSDTATTGEEKSVLLFSFFMSSVVLASIVTWIVTFLLAFVVFCAGTLNTIKTVEKINWSWKKFFKTFIKYILFSGLIGICFISAQIGSMGVMMGFIPSAQTLGIIDEVVFGLKFGIWLGAIPGLIMGIIKGLTIEMNEEKIIPNQGIILSLKNGFLVGLRVALIVSSIAMLFYQQHELAVIFVGLGLGTIFGLNKGLSTVIKHYALRLTLCLNRKIPYRFIPFLDYCTRLILLKRVGGGYIFMHRMLLEYFANLENGNSKSRKV